MRRFVWMAVCLLGMAITAQAAPIVLKRGVSVHDWLNWAPYDNNSGTYKWPPYRTYDAWLMNGYRPLSDWPAGDQFVRIRGMGFDFVRLAVDPGPLFATAGAGQEGAREDVIEVLEAAVRRITASGLKVVFDLHAATQVPHFGPAVMNGGAGSAGIALYRGVVKDVAVMLVRVGIDKVALEPYNEPAYYPCDQYGSEDWQTIMAATVADIRAISPQMTIVATGACGGNVTGLTDLVPIPSDANILYSFHMYEPHTFTHQRPNSDPSDPPVATFSSGLPWPAAPHTLADWVYWMKVNMTHFGLSQAEQQTNLDALTPYITAYFNENWGQTQLAARFTEATNWATTHGIPKSRLFMGEFGAILMPDDQGAMGAYKADRSAYVKAVRLLAESNGIPWAMWEYANPVGMSLIEPHGPAVPDYNLLQALGL